MSRNERTAITAARYQAQCRAIRLAGEKAVGVLLEAMKRSDEPNTKAQMKAAIELIREAHALDISESVAVNGGASAAHLPLGQGQPGMIHE